MSYEDEMENPENPVATIHTTHGDIVVELFQDRAPTTVRNFVTLATHVPGGAPQVFRVASEAGKLDVFDWTDLGRLTALSAMIGWFFVFLNDYGTDQVTVQRLLAVRNDRGVGKAIAFNAVNDLLINGMLIFIGIGMFAYFRAFPNRLDPSVDPDGMLPFYIMHMLPPGVSGLLVTAIFAAAMSSVDSGINSLATVIVNDWIIPLRDRRTSRVARPAGEPEPPSHDASRTTQDVTLARILTVVLGLLATGAALYASRIGNIVEMWMKVVGLFSAPILAIFVLGLLTRTANFAGWLVGAGCAIALTVLLQWRFADELMPMWLFPISFLLTTTVGYGASRLLAADAR